MSTIADDADYTYGGLPGDGGVCGGGGGGGGAIGDSARGIPCQTL